MILADDQVAGGGGRPRRPATRSGAATGADLWWAVPAALVAVAVFFVARNGLVDDAYITLSYVRNVAEHLHWGMIPAEESNTATLPLNVMMLTAATWITAVTGEMRPVIGLGILIVTLSAAMAVWAAQIARRINVGGEVARRPSGGLRQPVRELGAGPGGRAHRRFPDRLDRPGGRGPPGRLRSARGPAGADKAGSGHRGRGHVPHHPGHPAPVLRRPARRACRRAAVVGVQLVSLRLGYPDHAGDQDPAEAFGDATFGNGLWKMWQGGATLPLLLAIIPAAVGLVTVLWLLAAGVARRLPAEQWPLVGLGVGGLADFGAYTVLGVPPYHWYYVSSTVALGITGVFGLALLLRRRRALRVGAPIVVAAALAVGAVVSFAGSAYRGNPVIFGNWALPQEYMAIGTEVGKLVGDATVKAPPEIGTVAFACDCNVVDVFSDPGITPPSIEKRIDEAGPVMKWLLELNFSRLDRTNSR